MYFAPFIVESMTRGTYGESGLHLVFRENVQRFFDPFDHKEPFYIYFYQLPILFLPWAPVLVIALIAAFQRRRELSQLDYPTRYLLEAGVLIFLFFTASGSRRSYYILPLIPFCTLLCARFLVSETMAKARQIAIDLQTTIVWVMAFGGIVVAAILAVVKHRYSLTLTPAFFVGLIVFSMLAMAPVLMRKRGGALIQRVAGVQADIAAPLLGTAILMCGYFCFQQASLDSLSTTRSFVRSVHKFDPAAKDLAFYQEHPTAIASVVYYLNDSEPHPVLQTPDDVVRFLTDHADEKSLMITRGDFQLLSKALPSNVTIEEVAAESAFKWENRGAKSRKWVVIRASR